MLLSAELIFLQFILWYFTRNFWKPFAEIYFVNEWMLFCHSTHEGESVGNQKETEISSVQCLHLQLTSDSWIDSTAGTFSKRMT